MAVRPARRRCRCRRAACCSAPTAFSFTGFVRFVLEHETLLNERTRLDIVLVDERALDGRNPFRSVAAGGLDSDAGAGMTDRPVMLVTGASRGTSGRPWPGTSRRGYGGGWSIGHRRAGRPNHVVADVTDESAVRRLSPPSAANMAGWTR